MVAMTGRRLIKLLIADNWTVVRKSAHGVWLRKDSASKVRFTIVKDTRETIPQRTLGLILGPKQTGLGSQGLKDLDERVK